MEPLKHEKFLGMWITGILSHKTKEEIEDFFEIEIKSAGKHNGITMYNIYIKGTEIVYPWVPEYFVEENGIIQEGINDLVRILLENATEDADSNKKDAQKVSEEWEKQRDKEYKASLKYCPKCGCSYPKGTHFH